MTNDAERIVRSAFNKRREQTQRTLFAEQLLQLRLGGVGPDQITCGVRMQIVGHDGLGDGAVVLNQLRTEVQIKNVFAVVEPGELGMPEALDWDPIADGTRRALGATGSVLAR